MVVASAVLTAAGIIFLFLFSQEKGEDQDFILRWVFFFAGISFLLGAAVFSNVLVNTTTNTTSVYTSITATTITNTTTSYHYQTDPNSTAAGYGIGMLLVVMILLFCYRMIYGLWDFYKGKHS